jgi:hypothetical protein
LLSSPSIPSTSFLVLSSPHLPPSWLSLINRIETRLQRLWTEPYVEEKCRDCGGRKINEFLSTYNLDKWHCWQQKGEWSWLQEDGTSFFRGVSTCLSHVTSGS